MQRACQQVTLALAALAHWQKFCAERARPDEDVSGLHHSGQTQSSSQLALLTGLCSEVHHVGHGPSASLCAIQSSICHAECTRGTISRDELLIERVSVIVQRACQQVTLAFAALAHWQKLCAQRARPYEDAVGNCYPRRTYSSSQLALFTDLCSEVHHVGHGPPARLCAIQFSICHAECTRGTISRDELLTERMSLIVQRACQPDTLAFAALAHWQKLCAQRARPYEDAVGVCYSRRTYSSSQLALLTGLCSEVHHVGHGPPARLCAI